MQKRKIWLLALILFVSVWASGCGYNTLQAKQQNVKAKWANVESQLQRRADLIPNIVSAAQSAGYNDQAILGQIAEARSRLMNTTKAEPQGEGGDKSPEQKQAVIDASSALSRLLVIVEAYPNIKSTEGWQNVQVTLEGTENRINTSREDYNAAVLDYNSKRGSFPTVISAKMFGFKEEPYFKADEGAKEVPRIDPNAAVRPNQDGK